MLDIKQISSTELRYKIINDFCKCYGNDINHTVRVLGISPNTVRNAIEYLKLPHQTRKRGPHPIILPHHEQYIEARTISERNLSCEQLAKEMETLFPDIKHCSPQTIMRARKKLDLPFFVKGQYAG